ncbi:unnamed protein product [[Candida] boidinii]|nr:unnamed protein product [[Candida] boidinii]
MSNSGVGSNGGQHGMSNDNGITNNNSNNNNNNNNNSGRLNHHQVQQNVAVRQAQAAHQAAMTAAAVAAGMIDPNTLDPQAQAAAAQAAAAAAAAASGMFMAPPPPGVGGVPPQIPGVGVGGPHPAAPPPGVAAIGYYPPSFSPPNRNNSSGSLNDMDNINSPSNAPTDQEPLGIHPSQFTMAMHPLHHSSVPVGSVSGNPAGLMAGPPPLQPPPPPQMLHSHRSMAQLVYSDPTNTTVFVGGLANGVSDDTLIS